MPSPQSVSGLVVALGGSNDQEGNLSRMTTERLELARIRFAVHRDAGWKMLLTGGFGAHFNTTAQPHVHYAREWLFRHGLTPADFVPPALSGNTIEDARQSMPIVAQVGASVLEVVTSDFHVERATLVFRAAFPRLTLTFFGAACLPLLDPAEQRDRQAHEARAIERLREGGLAEYFGAGRS